MVIWSQRPSEKTAGTPRPGRATAYYRAAAGQDLSETDATAGSSARRSAMSRVETVSEPFTYSPPEDAWPARVPPAAETTARRSFADASSRKTTTSRLGARVPRPADEQAAERTESTATGGAAGELPRGTESRPAPPVVSGAALLRAVST